VSSAAPAPAWWQPHSHNSYRATHNQRGSERILSDPPCTDDCTIGCILLSAGSEGRIRRTVPDLATVGRSADNWAVVAETARMPVSVWRVWVVRSRGRRRCVQGLLGRRIFGWARPGGPASQGMDIAWGQRQSQAAPLPRVVMGRWLGRQISCHGLAIFKRCHGVTVSLLHSCILSCISSAFHPPLASRRLLASRHRPRNASETPDWLASASAIEIPHAKHQACRRVRASPSLAPASQASPRPTSSQRRAQTCG
jgi:hypothetical protein